MALRQEHPLKLRISALSAMFHNATCAVNTLVLDGAFTSALFQAPTEIWLSSSTLLYVIDSGNMVVRAVNISSKTVSTAAGSGGWPLQFTNPTSLATIKTSDKNVDLNFAADASRIVRFVT